jgi:prepilin-type N-terminal cleavage/methylation domain-containing protein
MHAKSSGFTLIEIAIVLVIIGLLLGGVLKGQELITSARVRNLISQQDGIKAAFFGFQDRYRALPGDYASASTNITCAGGCPNGDGNGHIDSPDTPGSTATVHEEIFAWTHLTAAGFLNGSYSANSATTSAAPGNTPTNPYSVYLQLIYDQTYGDPAGSPVPWRHNLKTGFQVPVEILAEIDRKIDDGKPFSGAFQYSDYDPFNGGPNVLECVNTTDQTWYVSSGAANCGGASLL